MAEETTTGARPFRRGDRVLAEHSSQPCRFCGYISPSIVVVECPNGSNRQRIEVARDRVWPDTEEGRVLQLTHRDEG